MTIKIIALVIGLLILCAGLYYLRFEGKDPESRKIYTTTSIIGGAIAAVAALLLFL